MPQGRNAIHDPRPGRLLTLAENHYYRARRLGDKARTHYQNVEDEWMRTHLEDLESAGVGWRRLIRDQQRGEGLMGQAWRLFQRARRWERLWFMLKAQHARSYKEHRDLGFGG